MLFRSVVAGHRLAVRAVDPGGDVERQGGSLVHAGTGKVPESALATPLRTVVTETVLREDDIGGDPSVVANQSSVASTSLAVSTVAVAASTSPSTDTQLVVADANGGRLSRVQPSSPSDIVVGETVRRRAGSSPHSVTASVHKVDGVGRGAQG